MAARAAAANAAAAHGRTTEAVCPDFDGPDAPFKRLIPIFGSFGTVLLTAAVVRLPRHQPMRRHGTSVRRAMAEQHVEYPSEWLSDSSRLSHLLVVEAFSGSLDGVCLAMARATTWLGPTVGQSSGGFGRHVTDMRLRIGDQPARTTFRKAAFVDLGSMRRIGDGYEVAISWRAASLAPLFPVFSGRLAVADGVLRLEGWYAPPGGALGLAADRALLKIAARGTGRWLLDELIRAAQRFDQTAP